MSYVTMFMPVRGLMRYFLHLTDGTRHVDQLGRELANDLVALAEARSAMRFLATIRPQHQLADLRIVVEDSSGRVVGTILYAELES